MQKSVKFDRTFLIYLVLINVWFEIIYCQNYPDNIFSTKQIHNKIFVSFPNFDLIVGPRNDEYQNDMSRYNIQQQSNPTSAEGMNLNDEYTKYKQYQQKSTYSNPKSTNTRYIVRFENSYPNSRPAEYSTYQYEPIQYQREELHPPQLLTPTYLLETYNPQLINPKSSLPKPVYSPDPRAVFASHSSVVKVHKPHGGSFFKSKKKKIIIGKQSFHEPHHEFHDSHHDFHVPHHDFHVPHHDFHEPHHDFHESHHIPQHHSTTINKNTHVHVHNRNAEEKDAKSMEINENKFIGSHLFGASRWRRDTLIRKKRGLIEAVRVIADPRTKIDVKATTENIGMATKNLFEHKNSPGYHARNTLGSAHDAIYSLVEAGGGPSRIFLPTRYKIIHANGEETVGAINPAIYKRNGLEPPENVNGNVENVGGSIDPLHKIGNMIKESIDWAQKSAEHAADAMHSARQVMVTAKKHWPQFFLPYVGAVEIQKNNGNEPLLGSQQDPEFIGIGQILDSLGLTDVKSSYDPVVGAPQQLSDEVHILNKAKQSLGVGSYKQFMDKIKIELDRLERRDNILKMSLPRRDPALELARIRNRARIPPPVNPKLNPALINIRNALTEAKVKAKLAAVAAEAKLRSSVARLPVQPKLEPRLGSKQPDNVKCEDVGLTKLREALERLVKNQEEPNLGAQQETQKKDEKLNDRLNKLRQKLRTKLAETDNSDILGKTIEIIEKQRNQVGAAQPTNDPEQVGIPGPKFSKQLKTPFMGIPTKQQLHEYFKTMYIK